MMELLWEGHRASSEVRCWSAGARSRHRSIPPIDCIILPSEGEFGSRRLAWALLGRRN